MAEDNRNILENQEDKEQKKSLFRESSLKRMSKTEKLNSCLKLNGMHIWLIVAALLLLIIGAGCYLLFAC